MPVSADEVRWAYRMLLGREPESDAAVASHLDAPDRQSLRERLLGSEEFRATLKGPPSVGRYLDDDRIEVQVSCSDGDLQKLLDGIAREWIGFGERDPHWSVLVDDRYFSHNIEQHEDVFYASGRPDVGHVLSMVRRSRPDLHIGRALDFGCGVGRLSLALAEHVGEVVGIDISPPHLVAARKRAADTGRTNTEFCSIASFEDLGRYNSFDLILSLIVLQHNPPPVMANLLKRLLAALRIGGVAVFQLPTFLVGQSFSVSEYFSHQQASMEMNALPQENVFRIIDETGCIPLEVREDGRIGDTPGLSHTFLVERRR